MKCTVEMRFDFSVVSAKFVERPNRFHVRVELAEPSNGYRAGEVVSAHCADPGRLRELLIPDVQVYVSAAQKKGRKTAFDLRFVKHPENGQLVSLDPRLPNRIVHEALHDGFIIPFRGCQDIRQEVSVPHSDGQKVRSRIDFRLMDDEGVVCWIEVKSATLVEDGCGLFPDAPTERGRRHLLELAQLAQRPDTRAATIFVIQRPDAVSIQPNRSTDPDFADALEFALSKGVEMYAYTCVLTQKEIRLLERVPVRTAESSNQVSSPQK